MIGRLAGLAAPLLAKLLLAVSAALLVSGALNGWMFYRWAFGAGETSAHGAAAAKVDAATGELAKVVGEVEALRETAERAAQIAAESAAEQQAITAVFSTIAEHAQQTRTVYKTRVERIPAADCPPGPERQQAFNEAMRE